MCVWCDSVWCDSVWYVGEVGGWVGGQVGGQVGVDVWMSTVLKACKHMKKRRTRLTETLSPQVSSTTILKSPISKETMK